jgi:hypothetical protein
MDVIYTPEVLNLAVAKVPAGHDIELPNNTARDMSRLQLRLARVDLLEASVDGVACAYSERV